MRLLVVPIAAAIMLLVLVDAFEALVTLAAQGDAQISAGAGVLSKLLASLDWNRGLFLHGGSASTF